MVGERDMEVLAGRTMAPYADMAVAERDACSRGKLNQAIVRASPSVPLETTSEKRNIETYCSLLSTQVNMYSFVISKAEFAIVTLRAATVLRRGVDLPLSAMPCNC